jgi:ABC-type polysaccharide/polyol phosphate transport system ATPase subunit
MANLLSGGTTLLFVSHSAPSVRRVCQKAMWLDHGEIQMVGPTEDVLTAYENT